MRFFVELINSIKIKDNKAKSSIIKFRVESYCAMLAAAWHIIELQSEQYLGGLLTMRSFSLNYEYLCINLIKMAIKK